MNAKIESLGPQVAKNGLKFTDDKEALKVILAELDRECGDAPPPAKLDYITAGLRLCDARFGWKTAFVRPSETETQRQTRENSTYGMMVQMYLLDRYGIRVGF